MIREQELMSQVLDFGAARDGVPANRRGIRNVVDENGMETEDLSDDDDLDD